MADEHFFRNGHSVELLVFDDSSQAMQQKYYGGLEENANLFTSAPGRRTPSSAT